MPRESGKIRSLGHDDAGSSGSNRRGIPWVVSLLAVGSLLSAGYWWESERRPGDGKPREIAVLTRREREAAPRLSNPVLLELLRQDAEGKVDERRWKDIRGLSETEVRAAINALGYPPASGLHGFLGDSPLRQMLFHRWGQLDPASANAMAKSMFPENFARSREAVIAAWIKSGGGGDAWEAVREEHQRWACTRSVPGEVAVMIIASLSDLDDASAFASVLRINDQDCMLADILCGVRATRALTSTEARTEFLEAAAAHPEPYVLHCAREHLFKEWAKLDVEAAEAGLTAMSLPENHESQARYWIDSARRDQERETELIVAREGEDGTELEGGSTSNSQSIENDEWLEVKEQVMKRWEKSPAISVDFDLREETLQLMVQIPEPDVEIWMRTLRSQYDDHLERDIPEELRELILSAMVQRGPGELIRSLAVHPVEDWEDAADAAMSCWVDHDPAAVLRWLDGDVPESMKEDIEDYREDARDELADD